jgi:hypothetical protein
MLLLGGWGMVEFL